MRVEAGNQRPWPADKVERWAIDRLIPYAKNARTHTDAEANRTDKSRLLATLGISETEYVVVTGCVDYGFVGRPEHHQTGFTFEVSHKAAAIPGDRC